MGARREYAVPLLLHRAGLLERFYTDACGNKGLGAWFSAASRIPRIGDRLSALAGRRIPEEIVAKTRTFERLIIYHGIRSCFLRSGPAELFREQLRLQQAMGEAMAASGYGSATHIYSMLGECAPYLKEGRKRGLKVVTEIYIALSTEKIVAREQERYPHWEAAAIDHEAVRQQFSNGDSLVAQMDFAICPSEFVCNDLVDNFNFPSAATSVVPYGIDARWGRLESAPVVGRVLFVGTACLRKGIHYLAMCAAALQRQGCSYEYLVAGDVPEEVLKQPECRHLTFLGRITIKDVEEQFRRADVFVLPTLAEGSAEAVYQALAAGVPVITTKSAGSVVRDGINGHVVPERDVDALAEALRSLISNRKQRDRMSVEARHAAKDYTLEKYGERLRSALNSMDPRHQHDVDLSRR